MEFSVIQLLNTSEAKTVASTIHAMRKIHMQANFEMHSKLETCTDQILCILDAPSGEVFVVLMPTAVHEGSVEKHDSLQAFEDAYKLVETLVIGG